MSLSHFPRSIAIPPNSAWRCNLPVCSQNTSHLDASPEIGPWRGMMQLSSGSDCAWTRWCSVSALLRPLWGSQCDHLARQTNALDDISNLYYRTLAGKNCSREIALGDSDGKCSCRSHASEVSLRDCFTGRTPARRDGRLSVLTRLWSVSRLIMWLWV